MRRPGRILRTTGLVARGLVCCVDGAVAHGLWDTLATVQRRPVPTRPIPQLRCGSRRPATSRSALPEARRSIPGEDRHRDRRRRSSHRGNWPSRSSRGALRRLPGGERGVRPRPGRRAGSSGPSRSIAMRADRWSWRSTASWVTGSQSLADLTRPEVKKIALANPATAPYGKAGKQALERAGLVGAARAEDRHGRIGAPGAAVCAEGRRRGRPGRPRDRERPRDPAGRGRSRALRPDHAGARDRRGHSRDRPTPRSS